LTYQTEIMTTEISGQRRTKCKLTQKDVVTEMLVYPIRMNICIG